MLNRFIRRTVGVAATLAVCGLLAACGGGDGEVGKNAENSDTIPSPPVVTAGTDNITVVFQMTGLLLAVPPKQAADPMQVIFPKVGAEPHFARFGFGGDSSRVCVKHEEGICYVDLTQWSLGPIGAQGTPVDLENTRFPRGVLNVTRGTGGVHKVNASGNANNIVTHVDFLSGRARPNACRMATWKYKPAGNGQAEDTVSLVNLLYWEIQHPRNQPFTITLSPRAPNTGADTTISLISSDSVFVVLAHVPKGDLDVMPPAIATPAEDEPADSLMHFHEFYKLLSNPADNKPPTQRPLPRNGTAISPRMCPVSITRTSFDKRTNRSRSALGIGGIKTFGCVVGSGEG